MPFSRTHAEVGCVYCIRTQQQAEHRLRRFSDLRCSRLEEFMFTCSLRILLLLVPLLYNSLASAQQDNPQTQPDQGTIYLDVVVTSKSVSPVTDLSRQDFILLNNKVPQSISSFKAVSSQQAAVEVILLVDAVNAGPETVAYERAQIEKFLSANSGRLDHPTTFAVFTK
jgi:hypothetical protein